MELRVVGCHGGETPGHRTSAFVLDEILSIDAGSITRGLELSAQAKLEACLISHAHLDHIRDLATLADNRSQMGCPPLVIAGTRETLATLRAHFFNGVLWPDFSAIPAPGGTTIEYRELTPEVPTIIAGKTVRAVAVNHTIDASGFVIEAAQGAIGYSGDTGPTERLWEVLNAQADLRALVMEVSFPDHHQALATRSGHHTPASLARELTKLRLGRELPVLLFHIKPVFQAEVEKECSRLPDLNLEVLEADDQLLL